MVSNRELYEYKLFIDSLSLPEPFDATPFFVHLRDSLFQPIFDQINQAHSLTEKIGEAASPSMEALYEVLKCSVKPALCDWGFRDMWSVVEGDVKSATTSEEVSESLSSIIEMLSDVAFARGVQWRESFETATDWLDTTTESPVMRITDISSQRFFDTRANSRALQPEDVDYSVSKVVTIKSGSLTRYVAYNIDGLLHCSCPKNNSPHEKDPEDVRNGLCEHQIGLLLSQVSG